MLSLNRSYLSIIRSLSSNTLIAHVLSVASAAFLAQLIGIVILPVLSRIYTPADFGVLAVYMSVVSILTMFTGLRYYLAVPLPKHNRYASALLFVTLVAHVVFTVLLTIISVACGEYLLSNLHMKSLAPYIYLIPLGVFTAGLYMIMTQWAVREELFSTIGLTRILQALSGTTAKLVIGMAGYKPIGLLLGAVIAQGCGSSTIIRKSLRNGRFISPSYSEIKRVIIRYRNFPLYDMWTAAINVAGYNMPQLFLSFYYSLSTVGLYTMAASLLSLPIGIVGAAVGQVFVQRGAQAKYGGTLAAFSKKSYEVMLLLSIYPIGLISLLGPMLFAFFLGKQWGEAGLYAIVLCPRVAYSMTYGPVCMLYAIGDKIKTSFYHEIILTAVMLLGLYLGHLFNQPFIAVFVYSILSLTVMIWRIAYILDIVGVKCADTLKVTFLIFVEALILLCIPAVVILLKSPILYILISVILSVMMYFMLNYYKLKRKGYLHSLR